MKHKTSMRVVVVYLFWSFVCLFLIFILFWYLNCLTSFNFIYLFIYFLLHNFLGTSAGPFPFITTDKNFRIRACAICHRFKCTWDEGSSALWCTTRPSVVVNFSHFGLLLWNHWTEFNETWQEARSHRLLPSLCFSGLIRKKNQDCRPGRPSKRWHFVLRWDARYMALWAPCFNLDLFTMFHIVHREIAYIM